MAVVITSTGGVAKRLFVFDETVDTGLVDWAASYLNETVTGLNLGARMLRKRLEDPELAPRERAFLATVAPVFTELVDAAGETLHVGGTGRGARPAARPRHRVGPRARARARGALAAPRACCATPSTRTGSPSASATSCPRPALCSLAVVAANYGLANRKLGTVSLVGPDAHGLRRRAPLRPRRCGRPLRVRRRDLRCNHTPAPASGMRVRKPCQRWVPIPSQEDHPMRVAHLTALSLSALAVAASGTALAGTGEHPAQPAGPSTAPASLAPALLPAGLPKKYVSLQSALLSAPAGLQTRGTLACPTATVPLGGGVSAPPATCAPTSTARSPTERPGSPTSTTRAASAPRSGSS